MQSNNTDTERILSDREIIERILGGSQRDYAAIIDRYKDRAMALALRMLKNRQDAEEATQDAFVRAFKGLEHFRGASKFGTWFYRIVYNVCLTRLGRQKEEFVAVDFDEETVQLTDSAPWPQDSDIEVADTVAFVRRTIETLPAKYAITLSLFYVQELSLREISAMTDLPEGTIKVRLHRARALLLGELNKEFQKVREVS